MWQPRQFQRKILSGSVIVRLFLILLFFFRTVPLSPTTPYTISLSVPVPLVRVAAFFSLRRRNVHSSPHSGESTRLRNKREIFSSRYTNRREMEVYLLYGACVEFVVACSLSEPPTHPSVMLFHFRSTGLCYAPSSSPPAPSRTHTHNTWMGRDPRMNGANEPKQN